MKKSLVYIQSGGPTSAINTSLYGLIREAQRHPEIIDGIYGSLYGIEGLIDNQIIDIRKEKDETIELLQQTPGSALGTTRYKLPKDINDPVYQKIINTVKLHNIGYIFVNGGNDSMDTCHKLSVLFNNVDVDCKVIGIPKTIDNDLVSTDHCIGFSSAAKAVINITKEICTDAKCYKKGKVFIIEIMGRNAGWLTASVDLLDEVTRPDFIFLPETKFDMEEFLNSVKETYAKKGNCVVAISEGVQFKDNNENARKDAFNHVQLGGACAELSKIVEEKLNLPTRAVELSLMQRANGVLMSKVDHDEAIAVSKFAFRAAMEGKTGMMVGITRVSDEPYLARCELFDISKIANAEKKVPLEMIKDRTAMTEEFRKYLRPLIAGSIEIKYENGIIKTAIFEKHRV